MDDGQTRVEGFTLQRDLTATPRSGKMLQLADQFGAPFSVFLLAWMTSISTNPDPKK